MFPFFTCMHHMCAPKCHINVTCHLRVCEWNNSHMMFLFVLMFLMVHWMWHQWKMLVELCLWRKKFWAISLKSFWFFLHRRWCHTLPASTEQWFVSVPLQSLSNCLVFSVWTGLNVVSSVLPCCFPMEICLCLLALTHSCLRCELQQTSTPVDGFLRITVSLWAHTKIL